MASVDAQAEAVVAEQALECLWQFTRNFSRYGE